MIWLLPRGKNRIATLLIGTIILMLIALFWFAFSVGCGCQNYTQSIKQTGAAIQKTNAAVETAIISTEIAKTLNAAPNSWPTVTPSD